MISEGLQVLEAYGWGALAFAVTAYILFMYLKRMLKVWNQRDATNVHDNRELIQAQLLNHQIFTNIEYKINNEIPTLKFSASAYPVRQKLFRKLLELKLLSVQSLMYKIVQADNYEKMTPSEWSIFIQSEIRKSDGALEESALHNGIPPIVISEYMMWQSNSNKALVAYVNDLAMSTLYPTNEVRSNTLLYLLNLQIITMIGDAERTLVSLNGDLSGMYYIGEMIESMPNEH